MIEALQNYVHHNWLLAISTPFYTILIALEVYLSQKQHRHYYTIRETLINFWLNIANTALGLSLKVLILLMLSWFMTFHIITITNPYIYWGVLFIGLDICFYFEHRSEHVIRLLWAVHVTHHSSQEYNLTTGFRSSVFRPFVSCWFFIPLVLIGFKPLDILLMDAICQIYGILVHTRYVRRMPHWFETFFVSPSHHRVHHASNVVYLDKNMGMVLIVWDKLFGTFQAELDTETVVYGLTKNPEQPYHPIKIITHEWKNIWGDLSKPNTSWKDKFNYLFKAPGWSHDGSTLTSKQMQNETPNENSKS